MSHNVHPYSHRLVNLRNWKSRWFATGKDYRQNLKADILLREHLEKKLRNQYVADIEFERGPKTTRLIIKSSRPGVIIGRNGEGAQKLRADVIKFMKKSKLEVPEDFKIDIYDVPNPESNSKIVAIMVREMLEKRMPFRRVLKQMVEKVMNVKGVKGCRITLAGRLGGAEMARREEVRKGGIPLQFIRADIDYATELAILSYGNIGIKVWIYKGDSLDKNSKKR